MFELDCLPTPLNCARNVACRLEKSALARFSKSFIMHQPVHLWQFVSDQSALALGVEIPVHAEL